MRKLRFRKKEGGIADHTPEGDGGGLRPLPFAAPSPVFRWREKVQKNDDGDRNADHHNRMPLMTTLLLTFECQENAETNEMFRNSVRAETAAAPAPANAYHSPITRRHRKPWRQRTEMPR